jgi:hypothetical protein
MNITISLSNSEYKDLKSYCDLNKFEINEVVKNCFSQGFKIEKYGLIPSSNVIEKEVIKYIEVPKIEEKIVEVIKEVPVIKEKIIEVIKEVDRPVDVVTDNILKDKINMLQSTITKLRQENVDQGKLIKDLERIIDGNKSSDNKQAVYLTGSNLDKILKK